MAETLPRHREHATETGIVTVRDTRYFAIVDPRAHYFASTIKADGGAWSPEHQAYIFPQDLSEAFGEACERIGAMPWLPLEERLAKFCGDELYKMGIFAMQKPLFADNPTGPKKRVYVAPTVEMFERASALVFEKSRITDEQLDKIRAFVASGEATAAILQSTPEEFEERVARREVDQYEAKSILRHLERAPEAALEEFHKLIADGRLTERQLGYDPEVEPERHKTFSAAQVYGLINEGRRMADSTLRRQVRAYQALGAFGNQEIYFEELTAAKARSLVKTGEIFFGQDEVSRALEEIDRSGFGLAGETGAYGQRINVGRTDQANWEASLERVRALLANHEVEGLNPRASELDLPTHGYVAGAVLWASASHAILAPDEDHYVLLDRKEIALEKGLDLRDHLHEFVAFACRRNDKPFGVLSTANAVGAAICEMDARQTLRDRRQEFHPAIPNGPVSGTVIALRGEYASLDLGEGGILTVERATLSNASPRYSELVRYEPSVPAAPSTRRTGRSR